MIKALIFDWHGVLDTNTFNSIVVNHLVQKTGLKRESVLKSVFHLREQYSSNQISPNEFWSTICSLYSLSQAEMKRLRKQVMTPFKNEELWELLPKLKQKYRLAILSDAPSEKVSSIKKTIDLSMFELTHFSSDKRISKKDKDFFHGVIKELNLSATECLFIDDTPHQIERAKKIGLQTCLYIDIRDIKKLL